MNFTANELARLMLDNAKGKVVMPANFTDGEIKSPDEAISDAFLKVMQLDKKENLTVDDIQLSFRKEEVRLGVFAIVEEVLREGLINEGWQNPFLEQFVESRSQARGDATVFYVESRNELAVSRISKDGVVSLDRQRFDEGHELEVKVATYGIKVYEHLARILLGRSDWGKFVMALQEAVQKDRLQRIYAGVEGVLAATPAMFTHAAGYNKDVILKTIRNVKMASGASDVILVGTDLALSKLQDASYPTADGLSSNMKDELHRTGKLGVWYGYTLMELPQMFEQGSALERYVLDDNQIYIIPNNAGKFVKEIVEPELMDINGSGVRVDDTIEFAVRYSHGVAVVTGTVIGRLAIQ